MVFLIKNAFNSKFKNVEYNFVICTHFKLILTEKNEEQAINICKLFLNEMNGMQNHDIIN